MSDYKILYPPDLKPALTTNDGADLKPALVTDSYDGGQPSGPEDIKPAILADLSTGELKPALLDGAELKPALLKDGAGGGTPQAGELIYDLRGQRGPVEVTDITSNDNDAVLRMGRAGAYNGSTSVTEFPADSASELAGHVRTIGVLFRVSAIPASAKFLVSRGGVVGGFGIYVQNDGTIQMFTKEDSGPVSHKHIRTDGTVVTGLWNVVEFTVESGDIVSAELNGNADFTVLFDNTGSTTYGDDAEDLLLGARSNAGVAQNFFSGDIASAWIKDGSGNLLFDHVTSERASGSLDGLPAFDRVGGNHGTYSNVTVTGNDIGMDEEFAGLGAFESTLLGRLEVANEPWAYWFGSGSVSNATANRFDVDAGATTLALRAGVSLTWVSRSGVAVPQGETFTLILTVKNVTGNIRLKSFGGGGNASDQIPLMEGLNQYDIESNLDDVGWISFDSLASVEGGSIEIHAIGDVSGGSLTVADHRRQPEQVGITDGNINTTDYAQDVFVPASLTTPGQDALGNTIANPLKRGAIRPSEGSFARISDDTSLDSVQTVWMEVYHDGTDGQVIDLGTPSIDITSNVVSASGITAPTIYIDGVAGTAITAGYHKIAVTSATPFDCGPIDINDKPIGLAKGWQVELTASEISRIK